MSNSVDCLIPTATHRRTLCNDVTVQFEEGERKRVVDDTVSVGDSSNMHRRAKSPSNVPMFGNVMRVVGQPTYHTFPGVEKTTFGDDVPEGAAAYACETLRKHFEEKEALKARVYFLLYQAS